jgi:hypothetical protein
MFHFKEASTPTLHIKQTSLSDGAGNWDLPPFFPVFAHLPSPWFSSSTLSETAVLSIFTDICTSLSQRKTSQKELTNKMGRKDRTTRRKQESEKKTKNYNPLHMNNSNSLSLVQGPSTVTCMIMSCLSQLLH